MSLPEIKIIYKGDIYHIAWDEKKDKLIWLYCGRKFYLIDDNKWECPAEFHTGNFRGHTVHNCPISEATLPNPFTREQINEIKQLIELDADKQSYLSSISVLLCFMTFLTSFAGLVCIGIHLHFIKWLTVVGALILAFVIVLICFLGIYCDLESSYDCVDDLVFPEDYARTYTLE